MLKIVARLWQRFGLCHPILQAWSNRSLLNLLSNSNYMPGRLNDIGSKSVSGSKTM
jgi:hypothetical protein